jgi:hypothetical protein
MSEQAGFPQCYYIVVMHILLRMTVKLISDFSVFSVKEKLITSGTRTGDEMRKTTEKQQGVKEREYIVIVANLYRATIGPLWKQR